MARAASWQQCLREDGDRGGEAVDGVAAADRPSSPAQNIPASAEVPSRSPTTVASWSGVPNSRRPRPLQVNTSAPRAARPGNRACKSSSALAASRTWNCTVEPTAMAVAHRHGAGGTIDAEHATDEEIAALELVFGFVNHDPAVQALFGELTVVGWQPLERGEQPFEGRSAAELVDHVAVGAGDDVGAARSAGSPVTRRLAGRRPRRAAPRPPRRRGRVVDEQPVVPGCVGRRRHAAHDRQARLRPCELVQQGVDRKRERIGDQEQRPGAGDIGRESADLPAFVGPLGFEADGDRRRAKSGGEQRDARCFFDFASGPSTATAAAPSRVTGCSTERTTSAMSSTASRCGGVTKNTASSGMGPSCSRTWAVTSAAACAESGCCDSADT